MVVYVGLQILAIACAAGVFFAEINQEESIWQQPIMMLPIAGALENIFYLVFLVMHTTDGYDPIPAVMGILLSVVTIWWKRKRGFDLGHTAANLVLNAIDDIVILLDKNENLLSYNEAAATVFKELTPACMGQNITEIKGFPKEIVRAGAKTELEVKGRCYECHTKVVNDERNYLSGYVLIIFDVTERFHQIIDIMDMREKAEAANQAKSNFLATISHEIRTPMNAIVGLSDLIMEESRGRKVYDFACGIKNASSNLLLLINDILDLSKVESGRMDLVETEYSLKGMIESTIDMLRINASQKGLTLKCSMDESLPAVLGGDEKRIRQILINIINNGLKFTKRGFVEVTVTGEKKNKNTLTLCVDVKDTGIGIKKEDLDIIFNDFQQVDMKKNRREEGSGLGLSISKKLAERMGGEIRVKSKYGSGSTFTVILPQKIVDECPISQYHDTEQDLLGDDELMFQVRGMNVLVVDDNKVNRKIACDMLLRYGFKVEEADCGKCAIDLVKTRKFHIIFMDHMMPEMDGIEATHIIRTECGTNGSEAIIVALTANAMEGAKEMFLRNGFQDFLPKPMSRKSMHELLLKYIPKEKRIIIEEEVQEELVTEDDIASVYMDGVNVRKALEQSSGTLDDYLELLDLFYMDGTKKIALLSDLANDHDSKNYRITVHGIKSASANIGASDLAMAMLSHEHAAEDEDWEYIDTHFKELMSAYKAVLKEIKRVLEKKDYYGKKKDTKGKERLPIEELRSKIGEALNLLENFKSKECAKAVEELLTYDVDDGTYKSLMEVQRKLKMYEDDEAEDLLRKAIERLS